MIYLALFKLMDKSQMKLKDKKWDKESDYGAYDHN